MHKPDYLYESHLVIKELSLAPGNEWLPQLSGWSLLQISHGTGYWLHQQSRTEIEAGMILMLPDGVQGRLLASQLNPLSLCYYSVIPERLGGLLTHGEQHSLQQSAARKELAVQILPATHLTAMKMKDFLSQQCANALLFRLHLLQLLVEIWGQDLNQVKPQPENNDATQRLRAFLREHPQNILLEISFEELAQLTNCTARHLSRIFCEVVGMSFRDKRAETRLVRARELLATSQSKVVEVALESGYPSLSLFNLMFTRRFGMSPGRWRKKNEARSDQAKRLVTRSRRLNLKATFSRSIAAR